MDTAKKYSLVSYLEGVEYEKVRALQEKLSEITGSTKCLTDWQPHITIGDGPEIESSQLSDYEQELATFAASQQPLSAKMAGFGHIDDWKGAREGETTTYVIWLNVAVSPELLTLWESLRDSITKKYPTWLSRSAAYVPHVTLAFADLNKEGYERGIAYIKDKIFESPLTISHIALVECYGVGNMTSREHKRFRLGDGEKGKD